MIVFDNVTKEYDGGYKALEEVSIEIKDGEFVSLVGPSGAGKSTMLKMLTREETPSAGKVLVDSTEVELLSDAEVPAFRRKIGTVFQEFRLLSNKTAFENVAFALEVIGAGQKQIKTDTQKALKIVGLEDKEVNFPHQLSGGEKQRVAIARALVMRPKLLLADEPTGNLDLLNSFDVIKLLLKINEFGTTVILASHDREVVNAAGGRVITMDKGKIVKDQEQGKYSI